MNILKYILVSLLLVTLCFAQGELSGKVKVSGKAYVSYSGADFFVSPSGNDSWSGTKALATSNSTDGPFKTISRAQTAVRALGRSRITPVLVLLRGGTYYLCASLPCSQLTFTNANDSGSSSVPIVWANFPTETPIIDGGFPLTGATNSGLGCPSNGCTVYKWTLPSSAVFTHQFWYNGVRRFRPRGETVASTLGTWYRLKAGTTTNAIPYTSGDPPDSSASWANLHSTWNGTACVAKAGNNYPDGDITVVVTEAEGVSRIPVWCVDTTNHIIYSTGNTSAVTVVNFRYLIENILPSNATAVPGTWFLDRSSTPFILTYYANPGENPNTDSPGAVIPQLPAAAPQLILAQGLKWVSWLGITFSHDNWYEGSTGYTYNRLDDASNVTGSTVTGVISCQGCSNTIWNNVTVSHTSGNGIEFFSATVADKLVNSTNSTWISTNNTVINSYFYDLGGHGIRVGLLAHNLDTDANIAQHTLLQNNLFQGIGRVMPKSFAVAMGCGHDNLYTQNDVNDSYGGSINVGALNCPKGNTGSTGTFNNVVSFNHVWNLGQGLTNDFGGVYINVGQPAFEPSGNQILYNRIHDITDASSQDTAGFAGQGIYIDNFTGGVTVTGNLVYRVSAFPMNFTTGPVLTSSQNVISNNIFALGRNGMVGLNDPWGNSACPGCTVLKAAFSNNIFYFDKTAASSPNFYFQRGCAYSGSSSVSGHGGDNYNLYMSFANNTYFNTTENFGTDANAFHYQTIQAASGGNSPYCANASTNWTFITPTTWQASPYNEDAGSTFNTDPGFVSPSCVAAGGTDNWNFTGSAPSGFTALPISLMGRLFGNSVSAVASSYPTVVFSCISSF